MSRAWKGRGGPRVTAGGQATSREALPPLPPAAQNDPVARAAYGFEICGLPAHVPRAEKERLFRRYGLFADGENMFSNAQVHHVRQLRVPRPFTDNRGGAMPPPNLGAYLPSAPLLPAMLMSQGTPSFSGKAVVFATLPASAQNLGDCMRIKSRPRHSPTMLGIVG